MEVDCDAKSDALSFNVSVSLVRLPRLPHFLKESRLVCIMSEGRDGRPNEKSWRSV